SRLPPRPQPRAARRRWFAIIAPIRSCATTVITDRGPRAARTAEAVSPKRRAPRCARTQSSIKSHGPQTEEMTMLSEGELEMRTSIFFAITAAVIATAAASTPAGATEIDQPIGLCNANPNCRIISQTGGGATLCVKGKRTHSDKTVECTAPGKGGSSVCGMGQQQDLLGNGSMVMAHD